MTFEAVLLLFPKLEPNFRTTSYAWWSFFIVYYHIHYIRLHERIKSKYAPFLASSKVIG